MRYKIVITKVETAVVDVSSLEEAQILANRFENEVSGNTKRTLPVSSYFHRVTICDPEEPVDRIVAMG